MAHFRRLRAAERFRGNLWIVPLLCAVLAVILERRMVALEFSIRTPPELAFTEGTAASLLAAMLGAMIGFLGIVFAFFMLVLQSASSQLSPRILALWYRSRNLKASMGIISAALIYTFLLLARVRAGFVPSFSIGVAMLLVLASIVAFLSFLNHVARSVRPAVVADRLARGGLRSARRMYQPLEARKAPPPGGWPAGQPLQTLRHEGPGRVLQGLDTRRLVADAREAGCVLAFCVAVGDFVPPGAPLARVYGGTPLSAKALRRRMALGAERKLVLDPPYALRLLVDIASRALSPGINDPSTAVQMLDRIGALLHELAHLDLDTGALRDEGGHLRILLAVPRWEDLLALGLSEIRHYGRDAPQVMRRMRALLEELAGAVPPERRPAVLRELEVLGEGAGTRASDPQGFGPSHALPVPPALH